MSSGLYSSENIFSSRNTSINALEKVYEEVVRNTKTTKERNANNLSNSQKQLAASMLDDYLNPMALAYHNIFSTVDEIQEYIYNKYFETPESAFIEESNDTQKFAMYQNDLNATLYGLDRNNTNFNDPRLNFSAEDWARINSTSYDLERLNAKMAEILRENNINLDNDSYFTVSFNPYTYEVTVDGNENSQILEAIERALNKNQNSKDFFLYILQNTQNLNQNSVDKMQAYQSIQKYTGERLNDLNLYNGNFYNSKNENVLDVMRNNLLYNSTSSNSSNSFLNSQYTTTSALLKDMAQLGWNNIPDLELTMVYSMNEGIFIPGVVYNVQ